MKERFDRGQDVVTIGTAMQDETLATETPTAKMVDDKYKPSSNDVDITELLRQENPAFFDNLIKTFAKAPKGFRGGTTKQLTNDEKRVKKERRKRARKARKLNR